MEKIKDIFYDKNDILIALLILVVAALVIMLRVGAIMDYPEKLVNGGGEVVVTVPDDGGAGGDVIGGGTGEGETGEGGTDGSDGTVAPEPELYAIYINPGESLNSIAQKFVDVGLFESVEQFTTLAEQLGYSTQIKTGNFIMPSDSTPEEVMEYIIKPGL